jgi:enoyl-[acyl-carrier protein] reductase III
MEPTEENIRAWDAAHRARAEPVELPPIVQRTLGDLKGKRVLPNYVLVGTSKAALESVVRYLAFDLAPRGIRVNCVSAGVVDTEALDWFPNKEQMLATVKRTPAGRLVEPEDVAAVVSFLCSPDAGMICGQTLVVDGGYSLGA